MKISMKIQSGKESFAINFDSAKIAAKKITKATNKPATATKKQSKAKTQSKTA